MSSGRIMRRLLGIPWPPLLGFTLILALVVALVVRRTIDSPPSPAGPLTVLVSGDTAGVLYPADCGPGQPGGLARRGEILRASQADGPVLYADLGNAPGGETPYDRLKFEAILRGEIAMGVAAHNLGPGELLLGADELQRLAAEIKAPFVSTNVRDRQGRPIVEPLQVIEVAGRRIALVGIVSPAYAKESLVVLDPATAIEAALAEKTIPYDTLLVLAYLPADELTQLGSRLPSKSVLVGPSHADPLASVDSTHIPSTHEPPEPERRVDQVGEAHATGESTPENVVAGHVGVDGRSLVRIDFTSSGERSWSSRDVAVAATLPEEPRQLDNLVAYHQELAKHDFAPADTGLTMPLPPAIASTSSVAGTHTCRACHATECSAWDVTRHAHAWQSLVNRGVYYDAACQRCHTTGYGWEGGFNSAERTVGTVSVGCESCHGPSVAHVLNPGVRTPLAATEQCVQCHEAGRSPGFDPAAAWLRIQHGTPAESGAANVLGRLN